MTDAFFGIGPAGAVCTAVDALAASQRSMPPDSRAYRSLR